MIVAKNVFPNMKSSCECNSRPGRKLAEAHFFPNQH
jgi:hypothetical protein